MKLTSSEALKLLENARKNVENDRWINHSICVGNTAGIIAKALHLDEDFAKTLGYIKDIWILRRWSFNTWNKRI